MNIILCGMPCSGKSYFGALAAEKLNRCFVDTDVLVMSEYYKLKQRHATCREITLAEGESYFRELESKVVKSLEGLREAVIAVGGGTFTMLENIPILRNLGWVIYLSVTPKVLLERLRGKQAIPSYLDENDLEVSFKKLLKRRQPLYELCSHYSIDVDKENVIDKLGIYASKERNHGQQ